MANTLLTPAVIAREALANLYNTTVMLPLVHTDFSSEFSKVGDTITVRKPATFEAHDFGADGNTIVIQNAVETGVPVVMNKHLDVSFEVTAKELTLTITDFSEQFIKPAMEAISQKVDALLFELVDDVYTTVGTAGATPSTIAAITASRMALNTRNVPLTDRYLVLDPAAENAFLGLEAFTNVQWNPKSNADALNEAALGRKFGFDIFVSNAVDAHTNGTIAHTGTFALNGAWAAGVTTGSIDGTTVTGTWESGSLFTVAGSTQVHVLTADATAAANAITVVFAPAVPTGGYADGAAVTRIANHTKSVAFHKSAFAFVTRPLALPMGAAEAEIINYKGLGLRVVKDYNPTNKKDVVSIDLLCGVKTLDPLRAVRLLG